MIFSQIYFLVQYIVVTLLLIVIGAMAIRMILSYTDPNPFGALGKFYYWLRTKTDAIVSPPAYWLSMARLNPKFAPLLTILMACVAGYFILRVVGAVTMMLDGIVSSLASGKFVSLIGFLIYGALALLSLAIVIRIVLSWVLSFSNPLLRFLIRITEPILLPFRRIIPPLGIFDISPIILLFLLQFLQEAVAGTLIGSGR